MRSRERRRRRACPAAIATHRWRLMCWPPGAGPLPAAAEEGGSERASGTERACLAAIATHRWRLTCGPSAGRSRKGGAAVANGRVAQS